MLHQITYFNRHLSMSFSTQFFTYDNNYIYIYIYIYQFFNMQLKFFFNQKTFTRPAYSFLIFYFFNLTHNIYHRSLVFTKLLSEERISFIKRELGMRNPILTQLGWQVYIRT